MRETQCIVLMHPSIRPVAENAAIDRHPCNVIGPQALDQRFVQWFSVPFIVFANQYPHHLGLALGLDRWRFRRMTVLEALGRHNRCVVNFKESAANHVGKLR